MLVRARLSWKLLQRSEPSFRFTRATAQQLRSTHTHVISHDQLHSANRSPHEIRSGDICNVVGTRVQCMVVFYTYWFILGLMGWFANVFVALQLSCSLGFLTAVYNL